MSKVVIPTNPTKQASIFPTMNSVADVEAYAESCMPITSLNELHALLKLQENTLNKLQQNNKE